MQKDKRKKGCPNEACELHKKQVKQGVEVDYCPKCGTKTIFVCEKCFCEIQDIDEKHIICDRCEAERKQKLEETKEKGKEIAAGKDVIITSSDLTPVNDSYGGCGGYSNEKRCPNCGYIADRSFDYCPRCGHRF